MNNILMKLKNIWQYIQKNPAAGAQFKDKYTQLLGKAKDMLTIRNVPEAGVSPRQLVLNALAKNQKTYNPVGQTDAQKNRETKSPTTLEEQQRMALQNQKEYAQKALTNF